MSQAASKSRAKITKPVTIPQLAELLGVRKHKLYLMRLRGLIHAERLQGGMVIMPDEANRVINSATEVASPEGTRTLFALEDRI